MINSLKLYNAYSGAKKLTLYNFRLCIINGLLPIKQPVEITPTRSRPPARVNHSIVKISETYRGSSNYTRIKQNRCRQCTKEGKGRKHTMYQCNNYKKSQDCAQNAWKNIILHYKITRFFLYLYHMIRICTYIFCF